MRAGWSAVAPSLSLAVPAAAQVAPAPRWVGAWRALPNGPEVTDQTVRQVVRFSLGGRALRVPLSNEPGTAPLVIGAAHIAEPGAAPGSIDPATDRALPFGGRPTVTVPPGAPALSDPVTPDAHALARFAVSLSVPRDTGPTATHPPGRATAHLSEGDAVAAPTLTRPTTSTARFFQSEVDVEAQP